ncbi:6PGL-like protein [Mya arenaria]|uniref:6-phosphogluconolactonase n=1 Tax=Mya arenaria TaxID=6604 RepID=A0ABY7GCL8_MYAAR|nr:6PGL-like protein [Mya arenaria]
MAAPIISVSETDKLVAEKLCSFVVEKANKAIEQRGIFTVGFSGGSLVKYLCGGLPGRSTDWSKWRVFFCDERHVQYDSADCTYTPYKEGLVDKVNMNPDNIFPIDPSLKVFPGDGLPQFDMLLLGMGPDGHTCSLFPGHPLLEEKEKIVAPISDSPKPPPARVTMTLPVVNNCRCAVFASCGEGKADMVQRVLEGGESPPLPAARVRPIDGELHWFLDAGAASKLKHKM